MRVRYSFSSRRTGTTDPSNQHGKAIPKLIKEVIDISDIIMEVIDSRFVEETRNKEIEKLILEKGKKIIYVINKSDLIDKKIEFNLAPVVYVSCKDRRGIRELRERICIEASRIKNREKVNVGIIGYPNTGKSSLINVLTGRASARTAKEAGFTKGMQKIRLKKGIIILDTPGLIREDEDSATKRKDLAKHGKIGVRTADRVKDPEFIVHELVKQYPGIFEKFYGIDAGGNSEILIEKLGRKKNILKKGNLVDADRTARIILRDWQDGKIKV